MIKRRTLKLYGHISIHDGLSNTIIQEIVKGSRKKGRTKNHWIDNISDWTKMDANQLLHKVHDRDGWIKYVFIAERTDLIPPTISKSKVIK